ncbi:hypothetical protein PF004_g13241 [Phytophthora fragariae]|uniref:HAT C-terminal dimerisation domain-containing protein n=1 Tax=Phytophthora fragariae TaxID=53985 RepID=A0A6G0NSV1_9STRA|nr:hypothetical protein PF004_g13241 [Phytophthora fragariae]
MMEMRRNLLASSALTIAVDGATNVLSRSMSNVIVHDPRPWFAEYLKSNLKKETAGEVFGKVASVISRLNEFANPPGTDEADQIKRVFAFVSDSCNLMRAVRTLLYNEGVVRLTYGCSAHALNNFCEDIAKLTSMKTGIRRAGFISKTIKNQNLLSKIFSELSKELVGKSYAMVLYSASRWSSVNLMFVRLRHVKRAITGVVSAFLNEKEERAIDEAYELPAEFVTTVMDGSFWRSISTSVSIFDPICKCIGVLENNSASLGAVYACFVYVYLHIGRVMDDKDATYLRKKLEYRWDRIASPVHALAFYCDPFYFPFRRSVAASTDQVSKKALQLGKGDLYTQCRNAIETLCRLDDDSGVECTSILQEFLTFSLSDSEVATMWGDPTKFWSEKLWSQGQGDFPLLGKLMMKVFSAPASTAGVERHHKVAKRIHSAPRNRMTSGKAEQQIAVAHNAAVADMVLLNHR